MDEAAELPLAHDEEGEGGLQESVWLAVAWSAQ